MCYREGPMEKTWPNRYIFKSDPWVGFCKSSVLELVCVYVCLFCWRISAFAKAFFAWINWLQWSKCRWLVFIHRCLTTKPRKSSINLASLASRWNAPKASHWIQAGLKVTVCPFWFFFIDGFLYTVPISHQCSGNSEEHDRFHLIFLPISQCKPS